MYIKLYESSTCLQLTTYTTYIHIRKGQINGNTSNKHNYIEQTDVNKGKFFSVKSECLHRVRRYFRTLTVAVELYFQPFTFSFPFWPFFSTLRPPALANSWLTASSCTVGVRRLQLPQYLLQVHLFSWEICRGFNLPCLIHPAPRRPKNKSFKIKFRSVNFLCCIIALQYKTNNKRSTVFGEVFSYMIYD